MKSLYSQYKKEREGKQVIEDLMGFAVFSMLDAKTCYLEELFVDRKFRKHGHARYLADQVCAIASDADAEWLLGSVAIRAAGATDSLKVLLAYGMELYGCNDGMIYFRKKIELKKSRDVPAGGQ